MLAVGGCAGNATKPTPPPPVADPLRISCPAALSVLSSDGQSRTVRFGDATTTGGTPPVQISCQPASDSVFKIGTTEVRCTASDAKQVTDSCPFTVTVIAPPRLRVTRFIAFGDSMTAGEIVSEGLATGFRIMRIDLPKSYPSDLLVSLAARYTAQASDLVVLNSGKPGELAVDGVSRLSGALAGGSFQALLLMEGANDFPETSRPLAAIRQMVQTATSRGLRVFLATLPPENPFATCQPNHGHNWAFVAPYNDGLRSIAAGQNAVLVDVYAAFNGDTTTLVDCDGLHPTAAGYQRIADTFFASIRQELELPVTPSLTSQTVPFVVAPGRR
jgi:lysophospholipase L1-like esterase